MSIDISSGPDVSGMQGPCPDGFHIPTKEELEVLISAVNTWGVDNNTRNNIFFGYFKIPLSGAMYIGTGTVLCVGCYGEIISSSPVGRYSYSAIGYTSYQSKLDCTNYRATGIPIRAFKDEPVVPDGTWVQLYCGGGNSGIFYNESLGLISFSKDGARWLTMSDKNLGASVPYVRNCAVDDTNSGCYFQRGNNYGFPFTGAEITCDTVVNTTGCGPGNYFCCNIFYLRQSYPWTYDWSSNQNDNLWGGECPPPTDISSVYIGENEAAGVYVGTTLVREPAPKDATIEWLLVGGGGAGGRARCRAGGGGGAGGLIYCASETLPIGTCCCIIIGAGGTGAASSYNPANYKGGNSCFGTVVAYGGGGGGGMCAYNRGCAGAAGGSGGGGAACNAAAGTRCNASYGNCGGAGYNTTGGGGGGAGGAGCPANGAGNYYGGAGGCGCTFDISGTSTVYASGGGGGGCTGRSTSQGGGCGGCYRVAGCAATTYGSGGGGGGCTASNTCCMAGGNGCKGVFIARYPSNCKFNVTGGTKYECNGYCIHCFTSNGTLTVS